MSLPWHQFRTQLFDKMEERRCKAAILRIEQIYWFIGRCSKLFGSPGTDEAQRAIDAIADEGTFLLVADSLVEFRNLFPDLQQEEAAPTQPARPSPSPSQPQPTSDARHISGRPFQR